MSQQVVYGWACVGVQYIVRTLNVGGGALRVHYPSEKNHQQTGCTHNGSGYVFVGFLRKNYFAAAGGENFWRPVR